jgi:hypothetical protein
MNSINHNRLKEVNISREVATLAKEKGFKALSNKAYCDKKEDLLECENFYDFNGSTAFFKGLFVYGNTYLVCTQTQLQSWLRKEKDIDCVALPYPCEDGSKKYIWIIYKLSISTKYDKLYDTFEEALDGGLLEALKQL